MSNELGRYRILRRIATSGTSEIFLGFTLNDDGTRKPVVVKRLRPELKGNRQAEAQFIARGRLLLRLRHPNLVRALALGQHGNVIILVSEYVYGANLDHVLRRASELGRDLPLDLTARIGADVLSALISIHEFSGENSTPLHLVHRGVAPESIMLAYHGQVKLLDPGAAKRLPAGRVAYLPPEQLTAQADIDQCTDLYSLGAVLFHLATGRRPFEGSNEREILQQIAYRPLPNPREFNNTIPEDFAAIVLRAMAPDRDARYQDAAVMRSDLLAFLERHRSIFGQYTLALFLRGLIPPSPAPAPDATRQAEEARQQAEEAAERELFDTAEEEEPMVATMVLPGPSMMAAPVDSKTKTTPPCTEPLPSEDKIALSTENRDSLGYSSEELERLEEAEISVMVAAPGEELFAAIATPRSSKLFWLLPILIGVAVLIAIFSSQGSGTDAKKTAADSAEALYQLQAQADEKHQPDALKAQPTALKAQPAALKAQPAALKAQPAALNDEPDALNDEPDALNDEPDAPKGRLATKPAAADALPLPGWSASLGNRPKEPSAVRLTTKPRKRRRGAHALSKEPPGEAPVPLGPRGAERPPALAISPTDSPAPESAAPSAPLASSAPLGEAVAAAPPVAVAPIAPPEPAPPAPKPAANLSTVHQPSEVVLSRRIAGSLPSYPKAARASGASVLILVKIFIQPDGSVGEIKFLKSPPEAEADISAVLSGWRFRPHLVEGQPVSTYTVLRFSFRPD